jgi:hypothetical protein
MARDLRDHLPLKPVDLELLLALADEDVTATVSCRRLLRTPTG